jgi:hypothetical protein
MDSSSTVAQSRLAEGKRGMFPSTSMDRALNLSSFADGVGVYMLAAGVGVAIVYNSSRG